jgi:putative SOS response-associated peptidase YedK
VEAVHICNLYSMARSRDEVSRLFKVGRDRTGNQPPLPAIFPDQMAPVARSGPEGRELVMMRWGFSPPPNVPGNRPVTNIRNTGSSYWRAWMKPPNRILVPATSFCEYLPDKPAVPHWFALAEDRPLFVFAGLWRPWTGTRGKIDGQHDLFGFLTTEPNAVVAPIHPKAMPVILTTSDECETWMTAPLAEALALQRPLSDGLLRLVATGAKNDAPPSANA